MDPMWILWQFPYPTHHFFGTGARCPKSPSHVPATAFTTLCPHGGPVIRGVTAMGNGMGSLITMITIHRSSIQKCVYLLFSQLFVLISYMYFYRLDSWLSSYLTGRHNCLRSPRWTTVDGVFFSHGFPVNSKDCF
jgi:hypothetical protein